MTDKYQKEFPFTKQDKPFGFLQTINEARGFYNDVSGLNNYSPEDIANMWYSHVVALVIMIQNKLTMNFVKKYADQALVLKNFKRAYTRLNDVGFMTATLLGNNPNYNQNKAINNRLSEQVCIDFFRMLRGDRPITEAQMRRFLMRFEKDLDISSDEVRSLRRRCLQLTRTKYELRAYVYRDMIRRLRLYNLRSEIIPEFKKLLPKEGNKKSDSNILTNIGLAAAGLALGTHLGKKK